MCRLVSCPQCGRPDFAGCGLHVEQVLGDVPRPQRCQCREARRAAPPSSPSPSSLPSPSAPAPAAGARRTR